MVILIKRNMLDTLFKFPIIMVDGDNEEKKLNRKESLALDDEEELDIIIGEAECPYYDFLAITDRWTPGQEGLERALQGKFDACHVIFGSSGSYIVPWTKAKFKEEYKSFVDTIGSKEVRVEGTPEELKEFIRINLGTNQGPSEDQEEI
jgi:hypothetical protein